MDFINQFYEIVIALKDNIGFALICVGFLWLIHIINWALRYRLNLLGIYPRHPWGLLGIIFSPFLHGNFEHLFFNSIPALVLIDLVSIYGPFTFVSLTLFIMVVAGMAVWLFGRKAIHVGASGLMMGYWGFLLINSFHQSGAMTIILALICLYYLSSMAMSLLPIEKEASWESHLFGCLAGMAYVYTLPFMMPWLQQYT